MSSINILNIINLNPTAKFKDPFLFEIVFECLSELKNGNIFSLIFRHRMESNLHWKCRR